MGTKRQRVVRMWEPPVSEGVIAYLETGVLPDDVDAFLIAGSDDVVRAAWEGAREAVLARWVRRFPGRRPWAWWRFDAPDARARLGGTGDLLTDDAALHFGIPRDWVWPFHVAFARRSRIRFSKKPIDPADPLVFESQARYLQRHGLLSPEEFRRLPPDAFLPTQFVYGDGNGDAA